MNNKGFAVSSVLYTLLLSFLIFLAVLLAMLSSSNNLISNSNIDLIDDIKLGAVQAGTGCVLKSNTIAMKINSTKGIMSWPTDFIQDNTLNTTKNGIKVECTDSNNVCARLSDIFIGSDNSEDIKSLSLKVTDLSTVGSVSIVIVNDCE